MEFVPDQIPKRHFYVILEHSFLQNEADSAKKNWLLVLMLIPYKNQYIHDLPGQINTWWKHQQGVDWYQQSFADSEKQTKRATQNVHKKVASLLLLKLEMTAQNEDLTGISF